MSKTNHTVLVRSEDVTKLLATKSTRKSPRTSFQIQRAEVVVLSRLATVELLKNASSQSETETPQHDVPVNFSAVLLNTQGEYSGGFVKPMLAKHVSLLENTESAVLLFASKDSDYCIWSAKKMPLLTDHMLEFASIYILYPDRSELIIFNTLAADAYRKRPTTYAPTVSQGAAQLQELIRLIDRGSDMTDDQRRVMMVIAGIVCRNAHFSIP